MAKPTILKSVDEEQVFIEMEEVRDRITAFLKSNRDESLNAESKLLFAMLNAMVALMERSMMAHPPL
jgi:hypothetical protein